MTLNDERVQFYFRHREQLEEWFALRSDAAAAIDEWLAALSVDLDSLVAELGDGLQSVPVLEETAYPSLYLKRSTWPGTTESDAPVSIGLQWAKGKTLLGSTNAPYVGVRSDRTSAIGLALRDDGEFQERRKQRKDRGTPWWPAFSYVLPREPFPDRADDYRNCLIDSIREAWKAYAPAIDRAVASLMKEG
jgi:hypothetical protein